MALGLRARSRGREASARGAREEGVGFDFGAREPKKLSFKEQQEFDGIEASILAAEERVAAREAEVNAASTNHTALTAAWQGARRGAGCGGRSCTPAGRNSKRSGAGTA